MDFKVEFLKKLCGKLGLDEDLNFSISNYTGSRYSYTSVRWMIYYIAKQLMDGNSYFKPARTLEDDIRTNIYSFLYNEIQVEKDDDKEIVITDILNNFSDVLYDKIKKCIIDDICLKWESARVIIGRGSSGDKARKVYKILNEAIENNKQDIVLATIELIKNTIRELFYI